jgi:hypothetical protein
MESPHFGFIFAAYALATIAIGVMIAVIVANYRVLTAKLRELETARDETGDDA